MSQTIAELEAELGLLKKSREAVDAKIRMIDIKLHNARAMERAKLSGERITGKTLKKAIQRAFIVNCILENGPLPSVKIFDLAKIYLSASVNYNTLRSHLKRMADEGKLRRDHLGLWSIKENS